MLLVSENLSSFVFYNEPNVTTYVMLTEVDRYFWFISLPGVRVTGTGLYTLEAPT